MNDKPLSDVPMPPIFESWEGLARLGRLARKELTEILRDRRTILTLILMPLLLYPLLTVAFQQYFLASQPNLEYRIGFANEMQVKVFLAILNDGREALDRNVKPKETKRPPGKKIAVPDPELKAILVEDMDRSIRERIVDIGIRIDNLNEVAKGRTGILHGEIIFQPDSPAAAATMSYINRCLAARNLSLLERELAKRPAPSGGPVLKLNRVALESIGASDGTVSLSALVPFILILMTITGAVYPAIDLTAGERERGTLEILVAAPVPRLGLLFAKYVAVLTVAIMTALINLTAMFATLKFSGWGRMLFGDRELPFVWILALLGLLILFASFFSAVLLILTSFARSFKEAQAYLIPLMLASLGPGLAGIIPGLKLHGPLTVMPLVNIVLLARDIFEGGAEPLAVILVTTSTLLYAGIAITLAAKIFGAEEVLYSEQSGWSDLWRRPRTPEPTASVSGALICLALMVPLSFVLRGVVQGLEPSILVALLTQIYLCIILFVLMPTAAACWSRVNLRQGFCLIAPSGLALLGALILGLTLWPLVVQLMFYLHADVPDWLKEQTEAGVLALRSAGGLFSATLAIAALSEEYFFRGYLFSALARAMRPAGVVVLTAVLFGLMHGLLGGGLGFEQVLPATLLGLILGAVRWRSGSVFPGMLLHLAHNVVLSYILLHFTGEGAGSWQDNVPERFQVLGLIGVPVGAGLVYWGRRSRG
jgi:sodium transport system permease protein